MNPLRKLGVATALALTATAAPSVPAGATTTSVSGTFVLATGAACTDPPAGFDELTFVISGDLEGCWYTNVERGLDLGPPSGLYVETGREVFVGQLRGGSDGTFSTTYTFESRWDPSYTSGGSELWGRCQHLIVRGSGGGGLQGATGFLLRTDTATDGSRGTYRGVVRQP